MPEFRVRRGGTLSLDILVPRRRQVIEEQIISSEADDPVQPIWGGPLQASKAAPDQSKVKLILTYTASAGSITAGQTVTFTFTTTRHTTSLKLVNLSTGAETDLTGQIPAGSTTVTPAGPTSGSSVAREYRLVADGSYGHHEEQTLSIGVFTTTCQVINTFVTDKTVVIQGQQVHLNWATTGGTSATLKDLASGGQIAVSTTGFITLTPASTRTYRLTLNGPCTAVTADITITVTPGEQSITTYAASATNITAGQSVTLSWSTVNATEVTLTDMSTGTVETVAANGSTVKTPASTRTYRLTAKGAAPDLSQDIAITVT